MSKPIEIKVKGCKGCPMWKPVEGLCSHPYNMYDGDLIKEFIEHCPLKEKDTVIKFVREQ